MEQVNPKRIELLKQGKSAKGAVIYWMSREMRVQDNWALLYAQQLAVENGKPLFVCFCLMDDFLGANIRHYGFMLDGLKEVESDLKEKNIPFYLLQGKPQDKISDFANKVDAHSLVTDFNPLKIKLKWDEEVAERIEVPFYRVDAHNICPCRHVSGKQEYSARTIRPKIHKILPEFLTEFPELKSQQGNFDFPQTDWTYIKQNLKVDRNISEIKWLKAGEQAAFERLRDFIENKFDNYDKGRNDPTKDAMSNLSPYLHFGHISAQRAAIEIEKSDADAASKEAFLEQLIVRRELADNYCFYNPYYDLVKGFPAWAQKSLQEHKDDIRAYIYSLDEFENAKTHEELWNASQLEMLKTGKMHGYMRMYWAKKILEWSSSAEEALKIAIYLNDKYELDGRDPNGYVGINWSIGGLHDRPWFNHDVYGSIRYMSYNGCKSKFDVGKYIAMVKKL